MLLEKILGWLGVICGFGFGGYIYYLIWQGRNYEKNSFDNGKDFSFKDFINKT